MDKVGDLSSSRSSDEELLVVLGRLGVDILEMEKRLAAWRLVELSLRGEWLRRHGRMP